MDMTERERERTVGRAEDLGAAIAEQRRRLGLSRDELAQWVGSNGTYVGRLERGETVKRMMALFETLDVLGLELVVRPKGYRQ